ncbi:hypothetical protein B7463_g3295, partial [Scytalidium lignicola]
MAAIEITGRTSDRFIETVLLLYLLDPSRGEPTVYGLDQNQTGEPRERSLKIKFLDSIALMCATVKDPDSISAASLEKGSSDGTVLRIASNTGVSNETLFRLREIIDMLSKFISNSGDPSATQAEILRKIIELDISKIQHYIKDVLRNASSGGLAKSVSEVEDRILDSDYDLSRPGEFLEWYKYIFSIRDVCALGPEIDALFNIVKWAEKGRKSYINYLKAAYPTENKLLPGWICRILKLGRYSIASRALVRLAIEDPALFSPMVIALVEAPQKIKPAISEEMTLSAILKRTIGDRVEQFLPRLASVWGEQDVETYFRNLRNKLDLTVHAEMQLVRFYDDNPDCSPIFPFIGYKTIILALTQSMKDEAREDLTSRLGLRRPVHADSTIGPSLGGLTGNGSLSMETSVLPERMAQRQTTQSIAMQTAKTNAPVELPGELSDSDSTKVESPMPVNFGPHGIHEEGGYELTNRPQLDPKVNSMVLHFIRANNPNKEDIICISDILDRKSSYPSWTKLLQLLSSEDPFTIGFKKESDFLLVNDSIRVTNERKFLACLQYLCNSNTLNTGVYVHNITELPNWN